MQAPATDEVLIRREGRAGRITMNRPAGAQRADAARWCGRIWEALLAWRTIPPSSSSLLDGAGERALCAGGDVRALYDSRDAGIGARARVLARRVPAQCADRPLPQALRRHPGRHRHGRRHRPFRPRAPPHRHGALQARHARDRHRPDPGRRRHLAAGARAGRGRRLPGPDRRGDGRGRCDLCPLRRRARSLGQARRSWSSGWSMPRAGRSRTPSRAWPRMPGPAPLAAAARRHRPRLRPATASRPCWRRWRHTPGEWAQKTAAALAQKSPKSLKLTLAAIRNARSARLARGGAQRGVSACACACSRTASSPRACAR